MEEIFNIATNKISGIALTSSEENALVDWLCYEENRQLYFELQKVWQLTGKLSFELKPDIEAEWDAFKILIPDKKVKYLNKKIIYSLSSIAAALVLFFGIWGAIQLFSPKEVQYVTDNTVQEVQLPDQSIVHLNKHSQLIVDKKFSINNRNVSLSGEALFEVTENKETPFIVNTINGIQAKVLGTHFNLKVNDYSNLLTLNVYTGKVLFGNPNIEQSIMVIKGQQATYDVKMNLVSKPYESNPNAISWKTNNFQFDNSPIVEVLALLEEFIEKKLILPDNSEEKRYSGTFNNPTEEQVAEVIGLAMGWDFKLTKDAIIFSEK